MTAIRLTFSVVNGKPEFLGSRRVVMRVPPARNTGRIDSETGTWLELQDKDGQRLFAAVVDATILSPMVEVRTGVGDPGVTLVKSGARQTLHVIAPDSAAASGFRLMQRDKKNARPRTILSGDI